jgi:hypothetical protein
MTVTTAPPVTIATTTLSPEITTTIYTTVTSLGWGDYTETSDSTQVMSTSTSTSTVTLSTYTTTTQFLSKTSTSSATATSSSTSFRTATSNGVVKVTQSDIFTRIITRIIQLLRQFISKVINILEPQSTVVKTPKGRVVRRVTVVRY